MKKIFLIAVLLISYVSIAQTLGYNDIGVLFSNEKINGSARFTGMSGAFGALGGDLSGVEVNPAGAAVFLKSEFALTLNNRSTETNSFYYGNRENIDNEYTNISQAGGVFVFRDHYNKGWGKIALGFNYTMANDFENVWFAQGNSNYPTWITDPNNSAIQYLNSDGQYFESLSNGKNRKYSFTVASQHNENLYLGASINTYDVEHYQRALLEEYNYNNNGDDLNASMLQELSTYGEGISFTFGVISKIQDNIRLGLAYQSPVWYNLAEDFIDYDTQIYVSNTDEYFTDYSGINSFDYKLRTPSKLTGSFAYVFNKQGLISIDYSIKNYSNIKLSGANFVNENQFFSNSLNNVGELRLGTEWIFNKVSLRGGYHFEKSPYKNAISSDNIEGFSLGAGYKFRFAKFDISYQKSTNTAPYNFYPQFNQVDATELDFKNSKISATITFNI